MSDNSNGSYRDQSEKYGLSQDEWWVDVRPRNNPKYQGKVDKALPCPKSAQSYPRRKPAERKRKQQEMGKGKEKGNSFEPFNSFPDPEIISWAQAHDRNVQQHPVPPKNNGKPIFPENENENGSKAESFEMGLRKDKELASSGNSESDLEPPKKLTFLIDPATILHQPPQYGGRSFPDHVLHRLFKQPSEMQLAVTKESTPLTNAAADANDNPQPRFKVLLSEALRGFKKPAESTKPEAPMAKKIKKASDYKFDFGSPPKKVRWEATFIGETDQINWEPFIGERPVPKAIKELWAETFESVTKPKDKEPKV
ncbi:hypothetical protein CCACVL1_21221 [Corchorus capsularis]|uniref:Uncharacterized protein n=1 Tax=Corchorus capsularis TaxID=210143 RepID=A0A1R3H7L0_COCAP|nr:hypothetical protein CCACVL1_21221 [Corchorus capsularis]